MGEITIRLVFEDWQAEGRSVYHTPIGLELTAGDFHHGSVFMGTLSLDADQQEALDAAWVAGYRPVFRVHPPPGATGHAPD